MKKIVTDSKFIAVETKPDGVKLFVFYVSEREDGEEFIDDVQHIMVVKDQPYTDWLFRHHLTIDETAAVVTMVENAFALVEQYRIEETIENSLN
jgi:hypothetical protein